VVTFGEIRVYDHGADELLVMIDRIVAMEEVV